MRKRKVKNEHEILEKAMYCSFRKMLGMSKWMNKTKFYSTITRSLIFTICFAFLSYTHWHMSIAVCKWRHLAHLKMLQFIWQQIQWNSVITNSVDNEHSVITNRFLGQIGHLSTKFNSVKTTPGYNEPRV